LTVDLTALYHPFAVGEGRVVYVQMETPLKKIYRLKDTNGDWIADSVSSFPTPSTLTMDTVKR